MLLKLAVRNIRRSVRDYAIYFVTLVFGVAVFYAFNSIGSQQILFDIEASSTKESMLQSTQFAMGMFSYVVAFVLAFLVVYANRFLIRRRKHEFGTYLMLGMSPASVSLVVLIETVVVGAISLAAGLAAGLALSQGLSFVTAGLFAVTMSQYHFVFSPTAFVLTLQCFALIYVVVALFNLVSVRRFKLIDLMTVSKRSERMPVRNPWICLVVFAVSIALLVVAYAKLEASGLKNLSFDDQNFVWATVGMLVGTLLLFWSLAGFIVLVVQKIPGVYLRATAPFTVRQFASKLNTAFASLWAVCVLLFFAVTTFSTGMGLVNAFTGDIERIAPYDMSLRADIYYDTGYANSVLGDPSETSLGDRRAKMLINDPETLAELEKWGFDTVAKMRADMPHWDENVKAAAQSDYYSVTGLSSNVLIDGSGVELGLLSDYYEASDIIVMPESQYNATCALIGAEGVRLAEGEYAMANAYEATAEMAQGVVRNGVVLDVAGHSLKPQPDVQKVNLQTNMMDSTVLLVVVPDAVVDDMKTQGAVPLYSYVNVMYNEGVTDADFMADLAVMSPPVDGETVDASMVADVTWAMKPWPVTYVVSKAQMLDQSDGLRMMITYLAVYIGFVLLVSTAAVLAIQQLSETSDSLPRYRLLSRLGCDDRMIRRSLFRQVLVYFLAPLAVAACHSACAIHVLSAGLFEALSGAADVQTYIAMAALFVVAVYGAYFGVTYLACRSMVSQSTR